MVKPDGVQRGLVGEIIGRFEKKGLRIVGMKCLVPSRALAESHYAVHKGKPFYEPVVEFITSGPVVAMCLEGPDGTIEMVRLMMGKTSPLEAAPGTIRGFRQHNPAESDPGSDGLRQPLWRSRWLAVVCCLQLRQPEHADGGAGRQFSHASGTPRGCWRRHRRHNSVVVIPITAPPHPPVEHRLGAHIHSSPGVGRRSSAWRTLRA